MDIGAAIEGFRTQHWWFSPWGTLDQLWTNNTHLWAEKNIWCKMGLVLECQDVAEHYTNRAVSTAPELQQIRFTIST